MVAEIVRQYTKKKTARAFDAGRLRTHWAACYDTGHCGCGSGTIPASHVHHCPFRSCSSLPQWMQFVMPRTPSGTWQRPEMSQDSSSPRLLAADMGDACTIGIGECLEGAGNRYAKAGSRRGSAAGRANPYCSPDGPFSLWDYGDVPVTVPSHRNDQLVSVPFIPVIGEITNFSDVFHGTPPFSQVLHQVDENGGDRR